MNDSRNYEEEDGDWPTVTVRMPEEWIELAERISGDESTFYDKSGVIRYAMDRKFEDTGDWKKTTEYDPHLEGLIREYSEELGIIEEIDEDLEGIEEDSDRMEAFLEGERERTVGNIDRFDYATTMYSIAKAEGDSDKEEKAAEYLKEHYPESDFTRFVVEE